MIKNTDSNSTTSHISKSVKNKTKFVDDAGSASEDESDEDSLDF